MNFIRPVVLATVFTVIGSAAWAADKEDHSAHHPEGAASSAKAPATDAPPKASMAKMDTQMKAMQEMHDKMMKAKTPEERSALMAEHMKTMQGGMAMMGGMGGQGMGQMKGKMPADMGMPHQMMEKRMEMMESMMLMMMDRMPAAPAK